jgi:hypothetical protein
LVGVTFKEKIREEIWLLLLGELFKSKNKERESDKT